MLYIYKSNTTYKYWLLTYSQPSSSDLKPTKMLLAKI